MRERASFAMRDLRTLNWREEILPIGESNLRVLCRDYVFWTVLFAGVFPQLIGTITDTKAQLSLYALLFSAVWGVVFRHFIVRFPARWTLLIASAAFTALIRTLLLLTVHAILPTGYMRLMDSSSLLFSLIGSVTNTGILEELCKAIPVLVYLLWKRRNAEPLTALLVGVFSGLGFAASENIFYGERTLQILNNFGIYLVLLRSLSTILGHAALSGIVAYFLVMAFLTKRRAPVLAVVGLGLAATLHGCYNWLQSLQPTFATAIDAVAFTLFYAYTTKLRGLAIEKNISQTTTSKTTDSENPPTAQRASPPPAHVAN